MSKLITRIKRLALALCLATPIVSWAETAMNPVTGEVELYTYAYTGDATAWSDITWRDADGEDHTDFVPQVDHVYDPLVIKQDVDITAETIEGWTFNIGLFNGANLTIGTLTKWQGGCAVRVGSGSKLTISTLGDGTYSGNIDFYVAAPDGITYDCDYGKGGTFNYYFAGEGSVAYQNLTGGNHTIKAADITLSAPAEKKLESKTLVSFSNQPTFTVNALVAIKDTDGEKVGEAVLSTINTTGTPTITTDNAVGTCELVREEGGLKLYYVDGASDELAATPSININFTHNSVNVTTYDEVGAPGYSVPGYYWNNIAGAVSETTTVYQRTTTGAKASIDGMSVTISDTRGSYRNTGAGNILHGYIDDTNDGAQNPTVEITGIPENYVNYRVVIYFSGDTTGAKFGYVTINEKNYWGDTAWGAVNATAFVENGNYVVSPVLSRGDEGTLTVISHNMDTGIRSGLAAIQIVKVDLAENDLVIPVEGDTTYTVEAAQTPGTVYLTGVGTLTLEGDYGITATKINLDKGVVLNADATKLDATTFTGNGTVVYDGVVPPTGKGWTDSTWTGTVWIKNKSGITGNNDASTGVQPNSLGNSLSKVKFSGVNGWIDAPVEFNPEIVLDNAGYDYALQLTNGNSPNTQTEANKNRATTIKKLSGSGTLCCGGTSAAVPTLKVYDASGFTGSINTVNADDASKTGLIVVFCDENTELPNSLVDMFINTNLKRTIYVASGKTVTLDSAATWTAETGFVVEGTLNANGTLASSHASKAVSGAGTVVFNGKAPTPTGDTWWKNTAWTGTVEIKAATLATNIHLADYGNTGSKVCMNGTTAYLAAVALSGNHNVKELVIGANGFTQNGSYSSGAVSIVLPCKLTGTGTYSLTADGNATKTVSIGDASEFDGMLYPAGNNCRFVVGETSRDVVAGSVVVGSGKVLKIATANTSYSGGLFVDEGGQANITGFLWTAAGITVDGTLTVSSRKDKIGGGTAITLGDTGILEITESGNVETEDSYKLVTGTGSIKLSGDGYYVLNGNYPSAMPLINEKGAALVVPTTGATIGSLSGTKGFRSDWSATPAEGRYLTIKQAQDTEWSGSINQTGEHRLTGVVVDPGESTTGTLTLTATQTKSSTLTVNGSVNLTGTWVGTTTVAGTIGGTGTLTGDLTFSEGSTLKAFSSDEDGLAVSGTVTCPEEGMVTVDVSAIEPEGDVALLKADSLNIEKFALADGAPEGYTLQVVSNVLTLKAPAASIVDFTVPTMEGAAITVKVGTETIEPTSEGVYPIPEGATVTVTYTATDPTKCISGKSVYTVENVTELNNELETEEMQIVDCVAKVGNGTTMVPYASLQDAVDAAAGKPTVYVEVLADGEATANSIQQIFIMPGDYTITIACANAGYGAYVKGQELGNGIYAYNTAIAAATFVWKPEVTTGEWTDAANWTSTDGTVLAGPANALYTAEFGSDATVTVGDTTIGTINVAAAVSIVSPNIYNAYTLTVGSVNLTAVDATLTITGVTLANDVTPQLGGALSSDTYYVKSETSGNTTTYTVGTYRTVTIEVDDGIEYTVNVDNPAKVRPGDEVVVTITNDAAIDTITVTQTTTDDVDHTDDAVAGTITFTMPDGNVTVAITLDAGDEPGDDDGIPADTTTKIPLNIDNDSTIEQAQAAADAKTVTVADAVKTALQTAGVEEPAYQAYFTKTAVKNTATEAWEVLVEIAPAVEAEVNNSAVAALEGTDFKTAEDNADVNIGLTVKPGLYYGVVCGTNLGTLGSAEVTLELATATSKTFTVTKPTGSSTACFIKVVVSATAD